MDGAAPGTCAASTLPAPRAAGFWGIGGGIPVGSRDLFHFPAHLLYHCLGLRRHLAPGEHEMLPNCSARGVKAAGSAHALERPPSLLAERCGCSQGAASPVPQRSQANPMSQVCPPGAQWHRDKPRQLKESEASQSGPGRISLKGWDCGKVLYPTVPFPSFHSSPGMHGYKRTRRRPTRGAGGAGDVLLVPLPTKDSQDTPECRWPWAPAQRMVGPLLLPPSPPWDSGTRGNREVNAEPPGHPGSGAGTALTCSEHMEFIPGICNEFICICPAMGFMFWTLVFPPAMETVMLMLLYMPC